MQGRLFGQERGTAGHLESLSISRGCEDAHQRHGTELYETSAVGACWCSEGLGSELPHTQQGRAEVPRTLLCYEPVILTCPSSSSRMFSGFRSL